jgi:hypothetical protein
MYGLKPAPFNEKPCPLTKAHSVQLMPVHFNYEH